MSSEQSNFASALTDDDTRLVRLAEDVRDMGNRVMFALRRSPRDHHYAIEKLFRAIDSAATALIDELDVDGQELVDAIECVVEGTSSRSRRWASYDATEKQQRPHGC